MKNIFFYFLIFFLSFSILSETEIEFSLNSDSIWRGLTQNNGEPTLGAEINFSLDNGFFSGAWIESCCSENNAYPNREVGYKFGYQKEINENFNISFNYVGTNYPNSKIDNYETRSRSNNPKAQANFEYADARQFILPQLVQSC